ncbi:PAAR domain-containing protein [Stenotrophomonas rhizophila]|uniref:PAAR domain-containing protein n=1 Tax=Stenotrophomonas rhizophila TaxID=216778 RepID=UPI002A699D42|nr:PAAR domain-containing protein [Stenotrophomonas rhizophila]MDY0953773.1 PAAR domain-containing protein [Stenotrophomonas rhizophila]
MLCPYRVRTSRNVGDARLARLFIVVGDSLSSGGTVVSGSPFTDIDGSAMARVGDRVICKAHGPGSIVSGDATLIIDGNPAARHGDKVSCGCQLIADGSRWRLSTTGWRHRLPCHANQARQLEAQALHIPALRHHRRRHQHSHPGQVRRNAGLMTMWWKYPRMHPDATTSYTTKTETNSHSICKGSSAFLSR